MDHPFLKPFIKQYRDKEKGILDLGKMLGDADSSGIKAQDFLHNYSKRLTIITLKNGMKFYAKPTSYQGASAEKIVSEIYRRTTDIDTPQTTIATLNGNLYSVTNDIYPSPNTERGEDFLTKIIPGGAQYVLPRIFGEEEIDPRVLKHFDPEVLKQIAEHYGLAMATKNWDANIGGMGFSFKDKDEDHNHATGLKAMDFENSLAPGSGLSSVLYANPFEPKRLEAWEVMKHFRTAKKDFIDSKDIATRIDDGAKQIDEIVKESEDEGFEPEKEFVDILKASMENTANSLDK